MARTKPAEQRRADLLEAGRELSPPKAWRPLRLTTSLGRAGVSKGLFYLYFRSKDDLLTALHDQFSTELADRIRAATDPVADWPAKLDACVKAVFDCYHERDDLHEVLLPRGRPRGRQPPGHQRACPERHQRAALAGGKAAGAFDVEDPEATAALKLGEHPRL